MLDAQTHLESAEALVRQRKTWQSQALASGQSLATLEQRLRMHLHVLGRLADSEDEPPQGEYSAHAWLACRLQAAESVVRQQAADLACQWIAEEPDSDRAKGACIALVLHRTNETDKATRKLYQEVPAIRARLVRIWHAQAVPVPQALLNQGELLGFDVELQAAVLEYAADQVGTGVDVFRYYYQPLLSTPGSLPHSRGVLRAAIRGGMLRGDEEALIALRRTIEVQGSADEVQPWLHLAALSGSLEFHPVLQEHARTLPESGYTLLALWGQRQAIPELVTGLKDPRTSEVATEAWRWLTGQVLPLVPRLSVVGEGSADETVSGNDDQIADLGAAREWWEREQSQWREGERRIFGRPMTLPWLVSLASEYGGRRSADFIALLGMCAQQPIPRLQETWFDARCRELSALARKSQLSDPDAARRQGAR